MRPQKALSLRRLKKRWKTHAGIDALTEAQQKKAYRLFQPNAEIWDKLQSGDKYVSCDGVIRVLHKKAWHLMEWILFNEDGYICYTNQCADPVPEGYENWPVNTKLPDEALDKIWGKE